MSRILITGGRAPIALDLARTLRRAGHQVHIADVFKTRMLGRFDQHTYASPVHAPVAFAADVNRLNAKLRPDLIIPLCEEIFHLARLAEPTLPLYAPPLATLMRLHSKFAFIEWANELGLDAPATERLTEPVDAGIAARSVFKPEFSRFGSRCLIKPSRHRLKHKDLSNDWLRQDYIAGEDLCFYALAQHGRLTAFAAYRSDWRAKGGASYHFQPLAPPLAGRLREIAKRLIAASSLTGQIACDLRHDADDRLWLIECNPRGTSGLHLLTHDPQALSRAFLSPDGDGLEGDTRPAGVGVAMILYGVPEVLRTRRWMQWWGDRRARDVLAGARLAAFGDSLGYTAAAALRGQDLAAFLTHDIECNGWRD